jgi:cytidylate kinase
MPILAITREIGSLGTHIGQAVAERLGYDFLRQEIILEAARSYEADTDALVATVEAKPRIWQTILPAARRHFAFVAAEVLNAALKDNVVIVGRWSTLLLHGVGHALRVRVCAPLELRAARLAERLRVAPEEARRRIQQSDQGIRSRMRQFFEVEWDDPRLYDLTLSSERMDVEACAALLAHLLAQPAWQASEASRAVLWDAALAARVRAALKATAETSGLDITIRVDGGRAELTGTVGTPAAGEAAERVATLHAGVGRVDNRLTLTDPAHHSAPTRDLASSHPSPEPGLPLRRPADRRL